MHTKVSASIVTYNGFDEARKAAASLLEHTQGVDLSLYLIDNASPDGTGEQIKKEFKKQAMVRCLPTNKGFGGGHNAVLNELDSAYHAVVNPDIIIKEDVLFQLASYLDAHPDVAVAVPRLLFPSGEEQFVAKRRPTVAALIGRRLPIFKKAEERYLMLDRDLTQEQEIEFCTGCFFMMRTSVYKAIGGFDERFFMYFEDADIGRTALQYGKMMYLPSVTVYHAWHRATTKKAGHFFMQLRSMCIYFCKWGF